MVDFQHLLGTEKFRYGDRANNFRPALFGGDNTGKYFRFFETRYIDGQLTPVKQGNDILTDLVSDAALSGGTSISGVVETPLYDLTHPELYKKFNRIRVFAEQGQWNFEYRTQDENGITQYKPLGSIDKVMKVFKLPSDVQGYRIGFRISATNGTGRGILNGFIIEDTDVVPRQ